MKCAKCLKQNDEMIKTKGYGKSYIPDAGTCVFHDQQSSKSCSGGQCKMKK
jgi:hypothetical protein